MDEKYKLKITPAAADDLENIYKYVKYTLSANNSAENMIQKISSSLKSLKSFPYMHELSRDKILKERGYRKLVIKKYVALYLIDEEKKSVVIARIFYGPMDYAAHI